VIAAAAGARHAASFHGVIQNNMESGDGDRRRFAADAASAVSFWAMGLRPVHRSGSVFRRTSVVEQTRDSRQVVRAQTDVGHANPMATTQVRQDCSIAQMLGSRQFPVPFTLQSDEVAEVVAAEAARQLQAVGLVMDDVMDAPRRGNTRNCWIAQWTWRTSNRGTKYASRRL